MKTRKAFTSGSALKGAHVAFALEKTALKRKQTNKTNICFLTPPPSVRVGGREPADLPRGSKSENLESRAAPILRKHWCFFIGIEIALGTGLEIG